MEFIGKVICVVDKSGTSKKGEPFKAAQIVVQEEGKEYPQTGVFDTFGDKVATPQVGEVVKVSFSLKGSEYESKWYSRCNAWKIESERIDNMPVGAIPNGAVAPDPDPLGLNNPTVDPAANLQSGADDLPF